MFVCLLVVVCCWLFVCSFVCSFVVFACLLICVFVVGSWMLLMLVGFDYVLL